MSSTVTVTVRCSACARTLASYYGVPRDPDARKRLAAIAADLLSWHRRSTPPCPAPSLRLSDRAEPR